MGAAFLLGLGLLAAAVAGWVGWARALPATAPAPALGPGGAAPAGGVAGLPGEAARAAGHGAGSGSPGPAGSAGGARWIFRDDLGQRVVLAVPPRRVACLGEAVCDLARALLGEEAVQPLAAGGERERLRRSRVDLVLLPEVTRVPGLAGRLRGEGIPAATLRLRHVGELPAAAVRMGTWLGATRRGRELAAQYDRRLRRVVARTTSLPPARRPPLLVLAWDRPPVWAGPGAPVVRLVEWAGGRLATGATGPARVPASPPAFVDAPVPPAAGGGPGKRADRLGRFFRRAVAAPARALLAGGGIGGGGEAWLSGEERWRRSSWPPGTRVVTPLLRPGELPGSPALERAAFFLPPEQLLGAGPAAVQGLERLAAWLHPELFPDLKVAPPPRIIPGP